MTHQEPPNRSVLVADRGVGQCEVEEEGLAVVVEEHLEVAEALVTEEEEEAAGEGVEGVDSVLAEVAEEVATQILQDLGVLGDLEAGAHNKTEWSLGAGG